MSVMSCGWKSLYGHLWSQQLPFELCVYEWQPISRKFRGSVWDILGLLWAVIHAELLWQSKRTKLWSRKLAVRVLMLFYNRFMHTCLSQTPRTQSCSVCASRCSEQLDFLLSVFSCSCFTVQILVEHSDFRERLQNSGRRNICYQLGSVCKRAAGVRQEAKGAQWELWPETSRHLGNSSFCWTPAGWMRLKYQVACWICEMKPLASASPFSLAEMIRWRSLWLKLVHLVQLDVVKVSGEWRQWLQMEGWFLQKVDSDHVDAEFSGGETFHQSLRWLQLILMCHMTMTENSTSR